MSLGKWCCSQVLTLNKSKFKAFCIPLENCNEIPLLLKDLPLLDKKVGKASHPSMYAWKTATSSLKFNKKGKEGPVILSKLDNVNQGFNDSGEGGSGLRLIGLLDRLHIVNVLVVVSRWYGGTPLGSARFKCISDVGHEALKRGNYLNVNPGKGWIDALRYNQS